MFHFGSIETIQFTVSSLSTKTSAVNDDAPCICVKVPTEIGLYHY